MTDRERAHVLVVEDNELVTSAMKILLESADWRVSCAHTLAEARSSIAVDAPEAALLDLTLPDGNGLSLIPVLREAGCETTVALTGDDDPDTRRACLDAGCVDVLVKPVPARELIARSAAWRGSHSAERSDEESAL